MKNGWRKVLTGCVLLLTAAAGLLYFPLRRIPVFPQENKIGNVELFGTGAITETQTIRQQFKAPWDYLDSISIYLQYLSEERSGDLCFTLYDGKGQIVFAGTYPMEGIPNYEWWNIVIRKPLNREENYTYEISSVGYGEKPPQLFAAAKADAAPESGEFYYNGQLVDGAMGFCYTYRSFADNFWQTLPFWCFHMLLGAILLEIVWSVGKRRKIHEQM